MLTTSMLLFLKATMMYLRIPKVLKSGKNSLKMLALMRKKERESLPILLKKIGGHVQDLRTKCLQVNQVDQTVKFFMILVQTSRSMKKVPLKIKNAMLIVIADDISK